LSFEAETVVYLEGDGVEGWVGGTERFREEEGFRCCLEKGGWRSVGCWKSWWRREAKRT